MGPIRKAFDAISHQNRFSVQTKCKRVILPKTLYLKNSGHNKALTSLLKGT